MLRKTIAVCLHYNAKTFLQLEILSQFHMPHLRQPVSSDESSQSWSPSQCHTLLMQFPLEHMNSPGRQAKLRVAEEQKELFRFTALTRAWIQYRFTLRMPASQTTALHENPRSWKTLCFKCNSCRTLCHRVLACL